MGGQVANMKEQDFRVVFGRMPDDSLLTVDEAACLVLCTTAALYKRIYRTPDAAPPAVRLGSTQIRFRAGAVRDWIRQLDGNLQQQEPAALAGPADAGKRKTGRPRLGALDLQGASVAATAVRTKGAIGKGGTQ